MNFLSLFIRRLGSLVKLLEYPRLLVLRLRGVSVSEFISLNQTWLQHINIATVLDIGAHNGHFAAVINTVLPYAQIYSFEPLPDCFDELQRRMANVKNFMGFNIAIGAQLKELEFERNSFTASSSFLKMTKLHKTAFPHTIDSHNLKVKIEELDTIAKEISIIEPLLIKIDVQGYEERVLRSGENTVKRAAVIIVETSFEELYENQPMFHDIYSLLINWGFTYKGALYQLHNPQTGQVLQADSIFIKKNLR